MTRGEIYRSSSAGPERGGKPSYYVVVSRQFIAEHVEISTVICAPIYSRILGIPAEVVLDPEHGVRHRSGIRCDFLTLLFKSNLTHRVATLPPDKLVELDQALACALDLPAPGT